MDGRASHGTRSSAATSQRNHNHNHKQRANVSIRRVNHGPTLSAAGESFTTMRGSGDGDEHGGGGGAKSRRGSLRNAVRKIFGRSSKENNGVPNSPRISTPVVPPITRHSHHRSEPAASFPSQPLVPDIPLPFLRDEIITPQTVTTSHIRAKTSSPYAVSFPKSVMLKPMDLGNPFVPHTQMKRRKTMPNSGAALRDAADAAAAAAAVPVPVPVPTAQPDSVPETRQERQTRRALSQIKNARRKSRSTDDLVGCGVEVSSPRQLNNEMRQWRESFQPDVFRASGFTTRAASQHDDATPRQEVTEGDEHGNTPIASATDTFESARGSLSSRSSPKPVPDLPDDKEPLRPASPLELSQDLEQRVMRLEAGLNSFQRSLERLTADRNRRTIVLRSDMATTRSSNDMRTPSMLADTLVGSLWPSTYEYEYGRTLRPSTSLSPPPLIHSRQQFVTDHDPDEPLTPRSDSYTDSVRFPTPPHSRSPAGHAFQPVPASMPPSIADSSHQQNTFHSVYQMLSEERSARQKLERHLHRLQQEISALHAQVNVSSQHNKHDPNSNMFVGSSARLQQMLQETEEAHAPKHASLNLSTSGMPPITSRFSGSDSEEQDRGDDEPETPGGAYLTPREERSHQSLAGTLNNAARRDDAGYMF